MVIHVNKGLTLPEIFNIVRLKEEKQDKIKTLKAYDTKTLRWFVNAMYNRDWSTLPKVDYKPNHRPVGVCTLSIFTAMSRIESALKYAETNPDVAKKNLIIVLEEVSEDEAKLLTDMFVGRKVQGISKSIFAAVYPEFFRSEETDTAD